MTDEEKFWDYVARREVVDALPYPLTVFTARYGGTYEGGWFIALNEHPGAERIADATGCDTVCFAWYQNYEHFKPIGRGQTLEEAVADLAAKLEAEPEKAWPNTP